ncbi:hypothetical protein [Rhizobium alvei]|uniref:Uncharacterized protein n=1 Tax=Rhizobium alvei TaxID=1132659 RepID=A0ABT8YJ88_9HYPH|nr:hypothetical protein [Rhizobium alvei]MDO6963732.1 hypothetical protein [Rhizobium alvei]
MARWPPKFKLSCQKSRDFRLARSLHSLRSHLLIGAARIGGLRRIERPPVRMWRQKGQLQDLQVKAAFDGARKTRRFSSRFWVPQKICASEQERGNIYRSGQRIF